MGTTKPKPIGPLEPGQTVEGLARMAVARGGPTTQREVDALDEFPVPRLAVDEPRGPAYAANLGRPAGVTGLIFPDDPRAVRPGTRILPCDVPEGWVAAR